MKTNANIHNVAAEYLEAIYKDMDRFIEFNISFWNGLSIGMMKSTQHYNRGID